MRLELYTTKGGLIYQCDDAQPVVMDWSAARNGVQLSDEHNTQIRAFGTKSPYISSIRVVQDGVGGRDFSVPSGMEIVLDGTTVESGTLWQVVSIHWSSVLYQHKLSFEKASQVMEALTALSQLNITVLNVEVRPGRCHSLSFQTPYQLGPIMCCLLCNEAHPSRSLFNWHPQTWKKVPALCRVTPGQAVLTLAVLTLCCVSLLLHMPNLGDALMAFDFWSKMVVDLFITALVGCLSPDVLGLCETAKVMRASRQVDRLVNRKRYANAR